MFAAPNSHFCTPQLVVLQSGATVVVRSDLDKGGTWSGATEALKNDYGLDDNGERTATTLAPPTYVYSQGALPLD